MIFGSDVLLLYCRELTFIIIFYEAKRLLIAETYMCRETLIVWFLIFSTFAGGTIAATQVQERKSKKVTRVKRPKFSEKEWDGIYFRNLFEDGLVGPRPAQLTPGESVANKNTGGFESAGGDTTTSETASQWSGLVSATTIEDEVKSIQKRLAMEVTTPVKFKSEYSKAHQSFSILSMLFGIVREYDSEVRWKRFANEAQISFERAAANSRVGTIQAYESCKRRKGDLEEMVRGGNFNASEKAPEELDWSAVIDRSPIMKRLQESKELLKQLSSNEKEFSGGTEKIFHESELIAAMGHALMMENMTDADDDGYLDLSKSMIEAANQTKNAVMNNDYEAASTAINLIDQSCNNCHDEWK